MKLPKHFRRLLPLILALLIAGIPAALFFSRAPVLVVTDASFDSLYGAWRIKQKQIKASLLLYRQVLPVRVSEAAGPDLVAISVGAASSKPYMVFFPYRYEEGAVQYSAENANVPVAVLGGRATARRYEGGIKAIMTDTASDLYRAGCIAALLAGDFAGDILFFHDETVRTAEMEVFSSGLKQMGYSGYPVFLTVGSAYTLWESAACVVVNGSAAGYFEKNVELPAVLFSWADPAITPRAVKVIFDDSPWALLAGAVKELEKGGGDLFLPSEFILLTRRFEHKDLVKKLRALAREIPDMNAYGGVFANFP